MFTKLSFYDIMNMTIERGGKEMLELLKTTGMIFLFLILLILIIGAIIIIVGLIKAILEGGNMNDK